MSNTFQSRSKAIALVFGLFAGLLIARLFFLQVMSHEYYSTLAERQQLAFAETSPRRGKIYFTEKDGTPFLAASIKSGHLAYINPSKIKDKKEAGEIYEALSEIFSDLDEDEFMRDALKTNDPFEIVSERITSEKADKIIALDFEEVGISPREWRYYPGGDLTSHVLGFVGFKGDEIIGRAGIEYGYDDTLSGYSSGENADFSQNKLLRLARRLFASPAEGRSLALTIEPHVQIFTEEIIDGLQDKWAPTKSGVIIMEPNTGRILAMAVRPGFDPNNYNEAESVDVFINPLVEYVYELGSIFKPLTMSIGLDVGSIDEQTTYFDKGFVEMDKARIENFDGKGRGEVNMQEVLSQSLNTGAVFVMEQTGKDKFKEYMRKFGLGKETGIDLPGEVAGNLSNLESPRTIEYATASFGQGVAVTPIEFVRAASILANGGRLVRPYVVERVVRDGIPDYENKPEISEQVIDPKTSERITRMLVNVVDDALLGGTVKMDRYRIAAKTGTAQIPNKSSSGYSGEFLHSFFGYGPAYDAEFMVFMFMERPQGVRYASHSLGESFMDIMKFLFSYYDIPPDR